jgi:uncharacterized protein (DUF1330 family)
MAKGYWVVTYRKVHDAARLGEYGKLAGPAVAAGGGRTLVRGNAAFAYEVGLTERVVLIEFDSYDQALATFNSEAYKKALEVFALAAERDFRIVEGLA